MDRSLTGKWEPGHRGQCPATELGLVLQAAVSWWRILEIDDNIRNGPQVVYLLWLHAERGRGNSKHIIKGRGIEDRTWSLREEMCKRVGRCFDRIWKLVKEGERGRIGVSGVSDQLSKRWLCLLNMRREHGEWSWAEKEGEEMELGLDLLCFSWY